MLLVADTQPDDRDLRAGARGEHLRHPREHVVGGVGLAHAAREVCQHFIRRRALAVDEPVGQLPGAIARGLERERQSTTAATNDSADESKSCEPSPTITA